MTKILDESIFTEEKADSTICGVFTYTLYFSNGTLIDNSPGVIRFDSATRQVLVQTNSNAYVVIYNLKLEVTLNGVDF